MSFVSNVSFVSNNIRIYMSECNYVVLGGLLFTGSCPSKCSELIILVHILGLVCYKLSQFFLLTLLDLVIYDTCMRMKDCISLHISIFVAEFENVATLPRD